MANNDIRWHQRFKNFEKAVFALQRVIAIENPNEAELSGIIHNFQLAFELGWKTMKDYLTEAGYDAKTPRDSIKQAFQSGIIKEGHIWIEMLDKRNELTHAYDESAALAALIQIKGIYMPQIIQVYEHLKAETEK